MIMDGKCFVLHSLPQESWFQVILELRLQLAEVCKKMELEFIKPRKYKLESVTIQRQDNR